MNAERFARLFLFGLLLGLPLALFLARWFSLGSAGEKTIEIHARMPEAGGWNPSELSVAPGETLRLRLISDDVMHSFAIGQRDAPVLDLPPGKVVETSLTFDRPGKYVFYCTRWCGPNHWRMRGTIEVRGGRSGEPAGELPLYTSLGIDLDAPHPASTVPTRRPDAERGARLGVAIPARYRDLLYLRSHSPAEVWKDLRGEPFTKDLSAEQVWDLVALVWELNTTPAAIEEGWQLYAQNCAACHGESGAGDGVMASEGEPDDGSHMEFGRELQPPTDFTDPEKSLGASPALLQGKILRGGMGTGMPYWGPVLTEAQTWALVDYLWTFQFDFRREFTQ